MCFCWTPLRESNANGRSHLSYNTFLLQGSILWADPWSIGYGYIILHELYTQGDKENKRI